MSAVLAPQISAIQQQVGQNIATTGQFQGRSGGTAAGIQQQGYAAQQAVQNLFDLLGPQAASELAAISGTQEGLGMGQTQLAESAAATTGAQASGARQIDVPLQQSQQGAVLGGLTALVGLA
jgi:hypothetical protein